MYNEHKVLSKFINRIKSGEKIALISDALGTPGISDPGFLLVRECIDQEIEVEWFPRSNTFVPGIN